MSTHTYIDEERKRLLIKNYNTEMAKPLIKPLHKFRRNTPDGDRRINNNLARRKKAKKAARKSRRANR